MSTEGNHISTYPCSVPEEKKGSDSGVKAPKEKKILHFSDGTMEQGSSDEEYDYEVSPITTLIDPKTLSWIPWIHHNASKALAACDYAGESIADFFGITSPKYSYEIAEAQRMKEDEAKETEATDIEMAGWTAPGKSTHVEFEKGERRIVLATSQESFPVIVCPP